MKKILALAILSISSMAFVPAIEAKANNASTLTANSVAEPQIQVQLGQNRRRYNRRARVVTQVRNVRRGRNLYRETYQTRYQSNGRVTTRLISRVLIRRY
jgi:hypothetical protein